MAKTSTKTQKARRKIGYVRVSDNEQNEDLQIDALNRAKCDVIYGDHGVSGAVTERKGLEELLSSLNKGDTLVFWKLDRFGRSALHLLLMLDVLQERGVHIEVLTQEMDINTPIGRYIYGQLAINAEYERAQLIERTKAGMAAAKARGKHIGRPRKLTEKQIQSARRKLANRQDTITNIARGYRVAPATISRALQFEKVRVRLEIVV